MELIRSLIFVPGNRENMLERARSFDADIIMVDLEDSVPPGEKATAREMAREWVPALQNEGKRVMVRQLAGHWTDSCGVGGGGFSISPWHQLGQGGVGAGYSHR
jgi:hypothetical protein